MLDHLFLIREQVKRDDAFVQADNLDVVLDEVNNVELALRELLLLEDRHDLTDTGLLQFRVAVVVDGRILDFHLLYNLLQISAENSQPCVILARSIL